VLYHWPGTWTDASERGTRQKEAFTLQLSIERAEKELGWHAVWDFATTVEKTVGWYREHSQNPGRSMRNVTVRQIGEYSSAARAGRLPWAAP